MAWSCSPEQRAGAVVGPVRAVGEGRGVVRGGVVQRRVVSGALITGAKALTKNLDIFLQYSPNIVIREISFASLSHSRYKYFAVKDVS